ncbi:MAG: DUF4440 domain-containing protein [Prolixibacteraceae bacterium]|nr:DUF4440 domain-containing protein [Burkholderiales bacterium]
MKLQFFSCQIDPGLAVTDADAQLIQLSSELVQELKSLEEALLRPEVRRSRVKMDALLTDDFVEYGRSGRVYDKAAILETADKSFDGRLTLHRFSARMLAPSVALVTYSSLLRHVDGSQSHSLRSSIWTRTKKGWRLVFHQGTPTIPAKE